MNPEMLTNLTNDLREMLANNIGRLINNELHQKVISSIDEFIPMYVDTNTTTEYTITTNDNSDVLNIDWDVQNNSGVNQVNMDIKIEVIEFTWAGGFIYNKTYEPNIIVSDDDDFWVCTKKTYGEFSPKESLRLKYPAWRYATHGEIFSLLNSLKNNTNSEKISKENQKRAIKI